MREFFKPWRRKLGVVTLVMALVLSIGWARCSVQPERIIFRTRDWTSIPFSDVAIFNEGGQLEVALGGDAVIAFDYQSLFRMQYWTIVIPLTLLSAYLLLSNRKSGPTRKQEVTTMFRWLVGESVYEKQLRETARQQQETARQQQENARQQDEGARHIEIYNARVEEAAKRDAEYDRRSNEQSERTNINQDRYAKLLDTWEEQARRFNAILDRWERTSPKE